MGTHPRMLSKSYPKNTNMTGFEWFKKSAWMKGASALEGLNKKKMSMRLAEFHCETDIAGKNILTTACF